MNGMVERSCSYSDANGVHIVGTRVSGRPDWTLWLRDAKEVWCPLVEHGGCDDGASFKVVRVWSFAGQSFVAASLNFTAVFFVYFT